MAGYKNWTNGKEKVSRRHDSVLTYHEELEERGNFARGHAYAMLYAMEISSTPREITTVIKTPKDLGIKECSTYDEIMAAAKNNGLQPCPKWTALEYYFGSVSGPTMFKIGNIMIIGTEPIPGFDGNVRVFYTTWEYISFSVSRHHFLNSKEISSPHFKDDVPWLFALPE